MANSKEFFIQTLRFILMERRFFFLLIVLMVFILFFPLFRLRDSFGNLLFDIFFLALLLSSIRATVKNKRSLLTATLLGGMAFGIGLSDSFLSNRIVAISHLLSIILFFVYLTVIVFSFVLKKGKVTINKIDGAICVYLFFGFIWTTMYCLIEFLVPGSFQIPEHMIDSELVGTHLEHVIHFLYYSLVTLSTLGYGDITPLSPLARMLSSLEAVVGQMYIAVLIARLVGLYIVHSADELKH